MRWIVLPLLLALGSCYSPKPADIPIDLVGGPGKPGGNAPGPTPAEVPHPGPPGDSEIPVLILQLGDESFEQRQAATEALVAKGPAALSALEACRSADPEVTERAAYIIRRIHDANWAFEVVTDKKTYKLGEPIRATLRFENRSIAERVFYTCFYIDILEGGKKVGYTYVTTKTGQTAGACWIAQDAEDVFRRVKDSLEIPFRIRTRPSLKGEKAEEIIKAPGKYVLQVAYRFDRAKHIARCENIRMPGWPDRKCPVNHHDPEALWNRAVEGVRTARVEFEVE